MAEASWRMNDSKECPVCRERFYPVRSSKKHLWEKKIYCSSVCSSTATAKRRYEYRNPQ